jgi:hypothetical protein
MNKPLFALAATILGCGAALASVRQDAPLLKTNFETDAGGWTAFGANATVAVTSDAGVAKEGKQALKFEYNIAKGDTSMLVMPNVLGKLKGAKGITFWAKAADTTSLMFILQEKDGGRYTASANLPKDQWQRVEFSIGDFSLNEGPGDPKDPNKKLDLDQVEALSIGDFGMFLAQVDNPEFAKLLNITTGKRALLLDDLSVVSSDSTPSIITKPDEVEIDTFSSPQVGMIAVGKTTVAHAQGGPLGAKSLMVTYRQSPQSIMGFGKGFNSGILAKMTRLVMKGASTKPMQFTVQLEEYGGGKWNGTIELPGAMQSKDINLKFEDFSEADDSKDDNKKLDLDKVNRIFFIDLTGLITQVDQENTLWISGLKVLAK